MSGPSSSADGGPTGARPARTAWSPTVAVVLGLLLVLSGGVAAFVRRTVSPIDRIATVAPAPEPESASEDEAVRSSSAVDAGPKLPEPSEADLLPAVDDRFPPKPTVAKGDREAALPVTADLPIWGPVDPLVTIVVFGDLECPHTREALRTLLPLRKTLPTATRLVWRHRPLEIHPQARGAALAAAGLRAAQGDRAFWSLIGRIAASRAAPTAERIVAWSAADGATPASVAAWQKSPERAARVDQDVTLAGQFAVHATPTLFVNGRRLDGAPSAETLLRLVAAEMEAAQQALRSGTRRDELYAARVRKNLLNLSTDER